MLEAVNSVLANAPLIRAAAEHVDAARSYAANPERIQEVPQAPFVSPYIHVDVNYDKAVLQIRDSETGDVTRQFPSEQRLQEISAQQRRIQNQKIEPQHENSGTQAGQQSDLSFVQSTEPQRQSSAPSRSAAAATPQQIAAFQSGAQTSAPTTGANVSVDA